MSDPLKKVLLGDEMFEKEMEKLIRVIRHGGAGSYKGRYQFTYPELREIARDGDFFDYFDIGDIITTSKETGVSVVASNNSLSVSIAEETFLNWLTENVQGVAQRDYELVSDGYEWQLDGEPVVLSNLGVTCTGTPNADDKIVIHEAASVIYWRVSHRLSDDHPILVSVFPNITGVQFCAAQKLQIFPSGLSAGTLKFTLSKGSYGGGTGADGSFVVTITQAIPAGGSCRLDGWGYWKSTYSKAQFINDAKFITYDASGAQIESVSISEYSSQSVDTDLGVYSTRKDQYSSAELAYKNGMEQQGAGYNEYEGSAIDQWANSDKTANNWFEPRAFDNKPNFTNVAGFLHGLDEEFIESVRLADVYTKGETVWENRDAKTLKRKFYLLSNKQVGFTDYADEGDYLDYYKQFGAATNSARADRIVKTSGGSAQYWWTRTAYRGLACREYRVNPDGSYYYIHAYSCYAVVLACEL